MYQLIIDGKKIATKKLLVRHNWGEFLP
jgi:hypothetical protein